jgi:hypothetical protein
LSRSRAFFGPDETADEHPELDVLRGERVTGDAAARGPAAQERRLAEAGPGHDDGQAPVEGVVQPLLESFAGEGRRGDRRWEELRRTYALEDGALGPTCAVFYRLPRAGATPRAG